MSKVRVYELARDLNIETKIILAKLKTLGAKITNHQSTLTDEQVNVLKTTFGGGASAPSATSPGSLASAAAAAAAASAGGKKVVIRRRAAEPGPATDVDAAVEAVAVEEPAPVKEAAPPPVLMEAAPAPVTEAAPEPALAAKQFSGATIVSATPRQPARIDTPRKSRPLEAPIAARSPERTAEPAARSTTSAPAAPRAPAPEVSAAPVSAPAAAVQARGPAPSGVAARAPEETAVVPRRREVGGATIVRRASPEEVEKLQAATQQRQAGRKEDARGTRVTGLGLLSNRVSSPNTPAAGGAAAPGGTAGLEDEAWASRRPAGAVGRDGKKALTEEEEAAKKKAAAKARRAHGALTTRALLEQAENLNADLDPNLEPPVDEEGNPVVAAAPVPQREAPQARTVYMPQASRNRRDIKRRKDLRKTQITTPRASYRVIEMEDSVTVAELAHQMGIKASEIIKKLMTQGIMATINQSIDFDTAALIAGEFQFEMKNVTQSDDDVLKEAIGAPAEEYEFTTRAPIVTVMGHVDHGKTSILDAIRNAKVAAGEAGGITQHIGAYSVTKNGKRITFLDTPGHEAFSAMRARGAKATDIVILVVAADDGVMPQTIEAISHAKAANVPIIVAVNKIDKPNLNFDRLYTELTEHGVQAEEWGGETQFIKVSALKGTGLEDLLEAVVLQAEVLDLKARVDGHAEGVVIEAHLDKGRGPVATIIVQEGTLKRGQFIVAGTEVGRIRAMINDQGKDVQEAGPSIPVEIIGLAGVPMAGDKFNIVNDERASREVVDFRQAKARAAAGAKSSAQTLQDLLARVSTADVPEVPFIVKGDTQGSVEAIGESIIKLNTDRVKNRIIHSAVGGITESDINMAQTTGAVLIGFNVRAGRTLDSLAEQNGVIIKYFSIIYEIVDAVKSLMVGKLPPIVSEVVLGHAEVRKIISVPKIGTIAGSAVTDGKITRASHCRLIREKVVIYTGKLGSLRRFKDDVKEVAQGYECGIGIDGYADVREGDVVEAYVLEETAATL